MEFSFIRRLILCMFFQYKLNTHHVPGTVQALGMKVCMCDPLAGTLVQVVSGLMVLGMVLPILG